MSSPHRMITAKSSYLTGEFLRDTRKPARSRSLRCILKSVASLAMALAVCSFFAAAPAFAHHGFSVEFDKDNPITVTGTVTKMEFMNPHIYFYVDVKGKDGKVVNWAFEGG